jgi:multiple sugar transport system permease protein
MRVPPTWRRRGFWAETAQAYVFLLPALLVIGVFTIYPFFNAFVLSTQRVSLAKMVDGELIPFYREPVGAANFLSLLRDRDFGRALVQTSVYVGVTVPLTLALALVLATFLNKGLRLRPFLRLAAFLPYITPVVAISLVWQWIYNRDLGLLNYFLGFLGADPVNWLNDPRWTLPAVIILNVWRFVGYQAVILLAGMQSIDKEYYDAAKVDGAGGLRTWWHVTVPLLTPQIFFVFLIGLIGAFKVFEEIMILFQGPGPLKSGLTMVYYIFNQGFERFRFGQAAAASVVLFAIIFAVSLLQLTVTQRRVHYER